MGLVTFSDQIMPIIVVDDRLRWSTGPGAVVAGTCLSLCPGRARKTVGRGR